MERKAKQIADWIVKDGCENSASGEWSVCAEDIQQAFGITEEECVSVFGYVTEELCKRDEVLELVDVGNLTLDMEFDTDCCKKIEGRRYEYRNGELKEK